MASAWKATVRPMSPSTTTTTTTSSTLSTPYLDVERRNKKWQMFVCLFARTHMRLSMRTLTTVLPPGSRQQLNTHYHLSGVELSSYFVICTHRGDQCEFTMVWLAHNPTFYVVAKYSFRVANENASPFNACFRCSFRINKEKPSNLSMGKLNHANIYDFQCRITFRSYWAGHRFYRCRITIATNLRKRKIHRLKKKQWIHIENISHNGLKTVALAYPRSQTVLDAFGFTILNQAESVEELFIDSMVRLNENKEKLSNNPLTLAV